MTPTLFGRWQTRIFLLATVGMLVSLLFYWGYLGIASNLVYFWVVFYVGLFGIAWDVLYDFLQKYLWDHDWPGVFQLYAGVIEGVFLALIIANIGLPHIPKTEFDLIRFIQHYGLVWLTVYLSAWVVMRLLFPRWRFRGGEWIGKWPRIS
jgi:hypothetical protein